MSLAPEPSRASNAVALLANLVVLLIVNLHAVWRPWTHGVVTDGWLQIVSAANLAAGLQVAGNALLLLVRAPLLMRLLKVAFSCATLVAGVTFYARFPFDFSGLGIAWLDSAARLLLVLALGGAATAVIVDLLRLAFPRPQAPRLPLLPH